MHCDQLQTSLVLFLAFVGPNVFISLVQERTSVHFPLLRQVRTEFVCWDKAFLREKLHASVMVYLLYL